MKWQVRGRDSSGSNTKATHHIQLFKREWRLSHTSVGFSVPFEVFNIHLLTSGYCTGWQKCRTSPTADISSQQGCWRSSLLLDLHCFCPSLLFTGLLELIRVLSLQNNTVTTCLFIVLYPSHTACWTGHIYPCMRPLRYSLGTLF